MRGIFRKHYSVQKLLLPHILEMAVLFMNIFKDYFCSYINNNVMQIYNAVLTEYIYTCDTIK